MDRSMDILMNGLIDEWTDRFIKGWNNGQMDPWIDIWMDR